MLRWFHCIRNLRHSEPLWLSCRLWVWRFLGRALQYWVSMVAGGSGEIIVIILSLEIDPLLSSLEPCSGTAWFLFGPLGVCRWRSNFSRVLLYSCTAWVSPYCFLFLPFGCSLSKCTFPTVFTAFTPFTGVWLQRTPSASHVSLLNHLQLIFLQLGVRGDFLHSPWAAYFT